MRIVERAIELNIALMREDEICPTRDPLQFPAAVDQYANRLLSAKARVELATILPTNCVQNRPFLILCPAGKFLTPFVFNVCFQIRRLRVRFLPLSPRSSL